MSEKLPKGWVAVKARDVCFAIPNGSTPKADKMADAGEVPFVKVYNLTFDGSLDFSKNPTFISRTTHAKALARSVSRPGDVLMNIVGPPLGKVSILPDTFPEWNFNQAIVAFQTDPVRIDNRYLASYLRHASAAWASRFSKATVGQHNIAVSDCREMELPLPPLNEQRRIVTKLEALQARSGRARMAFATIEELVERLVAAWTRKDFSSELLGEHIVQKTAEVGHAWRDYPVVGLSNEGRITARREAIGQKTAHKCRLVEPGDIVFNPIRFSIGSIARYRGSSPAIVSPEYQVIATRATLSAELLVRFLRSKLGRSTLETETTGSVRYRVYFKDLQRVPIALAPREEQAKAERLLRYLATLIEQLEGLRGRLASLDEALLAKAFRGELVAHEPGDVPAAAMPAPLSGANGSTPNATTRHRAARTNRGRTNEVR